MTVAARGKADVHRWHRLRRGSAGAEAMKQEQSIAMFQYWNNLRNGRRAPRRTEIEPAEIKSLLADTFILERDSRGSAVFRLAGTRLCAIYGRELKSFSFASLWREKDQRLVGRLASGAFTARSVLTMSFVGISRTGQTNAFELVLLPLDGGVDSPRCLGVLSAAERADWLGADPIADARIQDIRSFDPDRDLNCAAAAGLARSGAELARDGLSRLPVMGRRIRHLVVLDGGP